MIKRLIVIIMSIAMLSITGCQKSEDKPVPEPVATPAPADEGIKLNETILFEQNIPAFPMKGNPNALVTVLAYMDYRCPHCLSADAKIMKILKDNPGNVRIAILPMPNESDPVSMTAAKALIAAHVLGKFWELHDLLIQNSSSLTDAFIKYQMTSLGLDESKYTKIIESEETAEFIRKTTASASSHGLTGAPSFLVNGEHLVGDQPTFVLQDKIDQAIQFANNKSNKNGLTGESLFQDISKTNAGKFYQPTYLEAFPDAPVLGSYNATVTIEIFSDFACDHCAKVQPTLKELLNIYNGKIKFVYRHAPFMSQASIHAHRAAEAARMQGKFWEYAEKLYADQSNHNQQNFIKIAESLGLDVAKFTNDMNSQAVNDRISADMHAATTHEVTGFPCFIMNGTFLYGSRSVKEFQSYIDKELKRAQLYIDRGMKGKELYRMLVNNAVDPASLSGSPSKGTPDAPIKVIDFGDFQCQACADMSRSINTLLNEPEFSGKFQVYYKHRLAGGHKFAQKAAEASVYAHQSGKFWEFHDLLFINQNKLDIKNLKLYAAQIGLNATELEQSLKKNSFKDTVNADVKIATDLGINSIPAIVINGKVYQQTEKDPLTYNRLKEIFRKSIDKVRIESEDNICTSSSLK